MVVSKGAELTLDCRLIYHQVIFYFVNYLYMFLLVGLLLVVMPTSVRYCSSTELTQTFVTLLGMEVIKCKLHFLSEVF